jgi:hypothetical protein
MAPAMFPRLHNGHVRSLRECIPLEVTMHRITKGLVLAPAALLGGTAIASCISTTSGVGEATHGCPEFQVGSTVDASVKVDGRVRAFMQASADLGAVAARVKPAVRAACVGIAGDLGAQDTWSALGDSDDAISNNNGTGACDAARARIVAIMTGNANANFALVISRGACHPDFTAETNCEAGCSANQKCDSGSVETRCDPAQLSVLCQGSCASQAVCEGRQDMETDCDGQCEAECKGTCSGLCTDENGHETMNDAYCHGKCKDHCSGKCNGHCKVEATGGIQCGANVYCKAGCTGSSTSPSCETEFTPPHCTIDGSCFESCRASAVTNAPCDPPTVKLMADASAGADVATLVATINRNLPPLIETAEAQGRIAVDVVQNVATTGQVLLKASGSLDGKSIACAGAAGQSLAQTTSTLTVVTQAGGKVTEDCSTHSN